jgi:V-type H+-transporting ATPase subunit C
MSGESQLWVVAIKRNVSADLLKQKCGELCNISPFRVPVSELRVGTLDSLMSLSDDLVKMDTMAEASTFRMSSKLADLKEEEPTVGGVTLLNFVTKTWEWDDAKFQLKTPLRELTEDICTRLTGMDDELKTKLGELNALKANLTQFERKQQGNLMIRSLGEIVKEEHILESESMTTLFVVVPKIANKDFLMSYERLATFVVPKSAKEIHSDVELSLFTVVVLKKSVDEFKAAARDKRFTVRDFTFTAGESEVQALQREKERADCERLKGRLTNWVQINFSESFSLMMHLKAIRLFVESVLRYGLSKTLTGGVGPSFQSFVMQPKKGKAEPLRKALGSLFESGFSAEADAEVVVPGAGTGEFYPYVYLTIDLEAPQ